MSHFKLRTDLTNNFYGRTLFRVELTIDCKWGKKGEIGGWVEKESNISGDAWVSGDAQVYGNARVSGDAQAYGNAQVYGNARVYGNAQVYGDASKTPLHIIGQKYSVTISDNQVVWGCRKFTFEEIKSFEFKNCTTLWDENEFKLNKKIITEMIRYYRS